MGTPAFAVPTLDALVEAGHDVVAVYTQPPRPAGRGNKLRPSEVQARSEAMGIPVRSPATMKDPVVQEALRALEPDWIVVAAYGQILPKAVLSIPFMGCLNVHGSLLPRWRGAAPVQRAILAGDAETGICIMDMEAGMDTGGIRLACSTPIASKNTGMLMEELSVMGAAMMVEVLTDPGSHPAVPQPAEGVTHAAKIDKAEARIDCSRSAEDVVRLVRAMTPSPGAWFEFAGERIRVLCCDAVGDHGEPGTFLDGRMTLACAEGAIRMHRVQRAGKSPLHPEDLVTGFPIGRGDRID
jgi:methionyl-tRNA formyltransferase